MPEPLPPDAHLTLPAGSTPDADPANPDLPGRAGRFRLAEELGRGGMGVVLRADDPELGRSLAVKLLLARHTDRPEAARRFLDEARLTAQLQHPGVPPVHDVGALPDGRPFFAMKLIKGRTLAALLAVGECDLQRLLGDFEKVCQTIAYAHSKGIIHRDLKPSNVMVGAFGEVQVMDWGLAKVVGAPDDEASESSTLFVARPAGEWGASQSGTVMGTPAYMSPEQALGQTKALDARTDVFGLGAMLCAVLTGKPPYGGAADAAHRKAARADLGEAHRALDACGASPELVALAKRCLAPEKADRPATAAEVADAVATYRAEVAQRLHQAEVAQAQAEVRAGEERKRRRLAVVLAVAVSALLLLGGAGAWLWQRHRDEEEVRAARAHDSARALLDRTADRLGKGLWDEAAALLDQAREPGANSGELQARQRSLAQALRLGRRLDELRRERLVLYEGGTLEAALPAAYRLAFEEHAVDLDNVAGSVVREAILAALDDWGVLEPDGPWREKVLAAAYRAEPGPWRERFRAATLRADRQKLEALVADADLPRLTAATINALAALLEKAGADPLPLLQRARERHPEDFWLTFNLGVAVSRLDPGQQGEAAALFAAARALRPDSVEVWNNLGRALTRKGEVVRGIAVLRRAIEMKPEAPASWSNLAWALYRRGDLKESLAAGRRAMELYEKAGGRLSDAPYLYATQGETLWDLGEAEAAIAAARKGTQLGDRRPIVYVNLGRYLQLFGEVREANAFLNETIRVAADAIRRNPRDVEALAQAGRALLRLGQPRSARPYLREAVRLEPANADARAYLGWALADGGDPREAERELRAALSLYQEQGCERMPYLASVYGNLADVVQFAGRLDEAAAAQRRRSEINPTDPECWASLAKVLQEQRGSSADARTAAEQALRLASLGILRSPSNRRPLISRAKAHLVVGQYAKAARDYKQSLDRHGREAWVLEDYAEALWNWSTPAALAEGRKAIKEAIRLEPTSATHHRTHSIISRRLGKLDEAVDQGRQAVRLAPDQVINRVVLGSALAARRDFAEAVTELQRVKQMQPNYHFGRNSLGVALFNQGRYAEAVVEWEAAAALTGEVTHLLTVADTRFLIGDQPGSLLAGQRAIALLAKGSATRNRLEQVQKARSATLAANPRTPLVLGKALPPDQAVARLLELRARLDDFLAGQAKPRDAPEALALAEIAALFAHRLAPAARLFAEALSARPAPPATNDVRLFALTTALRALAGDGIAPPPMAPDHPERRWLRQQALAWVKEELAHREKGLKSTGQERGLALSAFNNLQGLRRTGPLHARSPFWLGLARDERAEWLKQLAAIDRLAAPPRMPPASD